MILEQRNLVPELMDDPQLANDQHDAALIGLRRINRVSGSSSVLWSALEQQARRHTVGTLRVLDVASGGGDTVVALSQKAHHSGVQIEIDGCDISPHAVSYASHFAAEHSPISNHFFCRDVLSNGLPDGYHVIMCSLFLHHLTEPDAIMLLSSMASACGTAVLVDDLRRTRLGYALAWTGCRLLTRSNVVHVDGPRSVQAAFGDEEVNHLATRAGLTGYELQRHWPQRFLLSWSKQ
jgi:2-polyprenyl-3-methyl-5-hydroxy-6-metoxy-1,4-benzoquinol methylase